MVGTRKEKVPPWMMGRRQPRLLCTNVTRPDTKKIVLCTDSIAVQCRTALPDDVSTSGVVLSDAEQRTQDEGDGDRGPEHGEVVLHSRY